MPPPAEGLASRLVLRPALRTQPDWRLVSLVREGYETAFEEIVRRYGRPLGRYAATIVGGRSEDVTQDAFSKALLALRRSSSEIELRPWLFRIVRNTALNDLRDSPPSPEVLAEALAGGRDPTEELEQREALADLMRRLQALPEPQRAAIVMRELEGLGHEEIAAALGLSGGAARQAIYRARQALRGGLGLMVPPSLLKALLSGAGTVEAAAGIGSAAGAGVALKATAATVLVAGAVGAGVVLSHGRRTDAAEATARATPANTQPAAHEVPASSTLAAQPDGHTGRRTAGTGEGTSGHRRHATEETGDRSGAGGSPERAGETGSGSSGDDHHGKSTQAESPSHGGRGPEDGSEGNRSSSGGGSTPEGDSGTSGGSGSGGDGAPSEGGSSSGDSESGSGDSGSGEQNTTESRDSQSGDGLTQQTNPEP